MSAEDIDNAAAEEKPTEVEETAAPAEQASPVAAAEPEERPVENGHSPEVSRDAVRTEQRAVSPATATGCTIPRDVLLSLPRAECGSRVGCCRACSC